MRQEAHELCCSIGMQLVSIDSMEEMQALTAFKNTDSIRAENLNTYTSVNLSLSHEARRVLDEWNPFQRLRV